jgi:hypothetical protein
VSGVYSTWVNKEGMQNSNLEVRMDKSLRIPRCGEENNIKMGFN